MAATVVVPDAVNNEKQNKTIQVSINLFYY